MAGATPFSLLIFTAVLMADCTFAGRVSVAAETTWSGLAARDDKALIESLAKRVELLERRLRELNAAPAFRPRKATKSTAVSPMSDAALLYQAALEDFASNKPSLARRALTLLIARYPNSPEAESARQRLAGGKTARKPTVRQQSPKPVRVRIEPALSAARLPSTGKQAPMKLTRVQLSKPVLKRAPNLSGWQADVRRTRELASKFKLTVGDRIFFPEGGATIGARARKVLAAQALWLKRHANARARLEGHADDLGTRDYNRDLAQRRATAVRARLIELGVAPNRLRITNHGNKQRITICSTAACKAQNRRVVAIVEIAADGH